METDTVFERIKAPWSIEYFNSRWVTRNELVKTPAHIVGRSKFCIANLFGGYGDKLGDLELTARLLAAAPIMYRTLLTVKTAASQRDREEHAITVALIDSVLEEAGLKDGYDV